VQYCYNIHDIVRIKSDVQLYELEYFACEEFSDNIADMVVIVSSNMPLRGIHLKKKLVGNKSHSSFQIKYAEHLGRLGAQFTINNDKNDGSSTSLGSRSIEIRVNKLISTSRHVLYVNLVEPILRFLLISKGCILLHSACMDMKGQGYQGIILSAPPDTGKTTTVLKCVRRGFSFLSDDMTIIRLPNEALCFPKPMTISAHTFNTAVNIASDGRENSNRGGGRNRTGLKVRSLVHSKGGRQMMRRLGTHNVPIFTLNTIGQAVIRPPKFKIEDLLQPVKSVERTRVRILYFLEKGGEETLILPRETALKKAVENSDDAFLFPPYKDMLNYISIEGRNAAELLAEEKRMLEAFLSNITCMVIKSDSRSWYSTVMKAIYDTVA
jgi:dolichol-phosphate mannosyltransferase